MMEIELQEDSERRPNLQKRTRGKSQKLRLSEKQQSTSTKKNQATLNKQDPKQNNDSQFESGVTLDEYFGTNFKPVKSNLQNNKFSQQINETDEDMYTESNYLENSNKISRQLDSRMNDQQWQEQPITLRNIELMKSQKHPSQEPDLENHIALRNANFQIYRSSQYGQSFLQMAQNLEIHQNHHKDRLKNLSLEKYGKKQNNNSQIGVQYSNTKEAPNDQKQLLSSTNYSQLNPSLYVTNYYDWKRKDYMKKEKIKPIAFDLPIVRGNKYLQEMQDKQTIKKIFEKENQQLILKYASKFNFNSDECKELFGNELKGKKVYERVMALKQEKQKKQNLFMDTHIQI